jgi:hypothetical protein
MHGCNVVCSPTNNNGTWSFEGADASLDSKQEVVAIETPNNRVIHSFEVRNMHKQDSYICQYFVACMYMRTASVFNQNMHISNAN